MTITVNEATPARDYSFTPGTLYQSDQYARNGNIYLIVGEGRTPRYVSAVRLAGSTFEYSDEIVKDCIVPFDGEVVIKND